jgi:hypothetical protein
LITQNNRPQQISKRIGNTVYNVEVRYDPASRETFDEKILRMLKNDLTLPVKCGIMNMPQTDGLSGRSST